MLRILPCASKNSSPSSAIEAAALSLSGTSRCRKVLNEVPASEPEAKLEAVAEIAVRKSSIDTPVAPATPPAWAMASRRSSKPNLEVSAAPVSRSAIIGSSDACRLNCAMTSVTRSAAGASSPPSAPAKASEASSAPPMTSPTDTPFLTSVSMASAACMAVKAVVAPRSLALAASRSISVWLAPLAASTRFIIA